jgi:hypothetical protein
MATKVDELIIEIKAETAKLRKGLDQVNTKLNTTNKTAKQSVMTFGNLAKVFAVVGGVQAIRGIVNTSRTFEDLGATLKAITGSAEGAALSMDVVRKFTMGTTFQLENVSSAFTTLLNAGITPTSDTLKDFGNLAAAFGKDITTVAQATFNATTGETEMLKQLGIKAKVEGDKMTMIFREQETEIGNNSTEIVQYLRNIAQENFDTALEERLNTVSGVFSNLGDMVSEFANAIGEGGLNQLLTTSGKSLLSMADRAKQLGAAIGKGLLTAVTFLGQAVSFVTDNMNILLKVLLIYVSFKAPIIFTTLFTKTMKNLRIAIAATRAAMILLGKNPLGLVMALGVAATAAFTDVLDDLIDKVHEFGGELFKDFSLDNILGELPEAEDDLDSLNEQLKKMADAMGDVNTKTKPKRILSLSEAYATMGETIADMTNQFSFDFAKSLLDGENALTSFATFAKSIVSQIIATMMQLMVVKPIMDAVLGAFGIEPVAMPTVDAAAGGGTVQANRPVLVGERGAEVFVPNSSGRIVNNANAQNMNGGGGSTVVNQNISFSTGIVPTVRAEVVKLMPQIAQVTKAAVAEGTVRGGSFRKAIQGG